MNPESYDLLGGLAVSEPGPLTRRGGDGGGPLTRRGGAGGGRTPDKAGWGRGEGP